MKAKLFFYLFLVSCNSAHLKKDIKLAINISYGQSYIIDLDKKVYTISFLSKPPLHIKFNLTADEVDKIKDMYLSLKLHDLKSIELTDTCMIHPKIYTYINIKSNSTDQQIKLDESCKDFKENYNGERVHKFIQLIRDIVESKPEIENAPQSDVEYI